MDLVAKEYLVCYLDARFPTSLTNGARQWTDLSSKGNHVTFQSPLISDGIRADMCSGGVGTGPKAEALRIGPQYNNGTYTVTIIAKCKQPTASVPFYVPSKYGERGISCHIVWPDGRLYYDNMQCCAEGWNRKSHYLGIASLNEYMYTFVRNPNGALQIYLDGAPVALGNPNSQMPELAGNMSVNLNGQWIADMKALLVHNGALSASQIGDLFRAHQKVDLEARGNYSTTMPLPTSLQRGVLLALDSSDPKCYNASTPLDVTDLSTRALPLRFTSAPQVSNGAWRINGDTTLVGPPSSRLGLEGASDYTVVYRCSNTKHANNILFRLYGYMGCRSRALGIYPGWLTGGLIFDQGGCEGDAQRMSVQYPVGKMDTYVLIKDSASRRIIINGKELSRTPNRGNNISTNPTPMKFFSDDEGDKFWGDLSHFIVYNRALSEAEIADIVQYCDNPYRMQMATWAEAQALCHGEELALPSREAVCFGDRPVYPVRYPGAVVPINTPGAWLKLSDCKQVQDDKTKMSAYIKCQSPKRAPANIAAGVLIRGQGQSKLLLFRDELVASYDLMSDYQSRPVTVKKMFPGLDPMFHGGVDAVASVDGKLYFYKGPMAQVYNLEGQTPNGGPQPVSSLHPGLASGFNDGSYDAVLYTQGKFVFIKGNKAGSLSRDGRMEVQPMNLNAGPAGAVFSGGVDTAILIGTEPNPNIVFVKEHYVLTKGAGSGAGSGSTDIKRISEVWPGLKPPYVSVQDRCNALRTLEPKLRTKIQEVRGTNSTLQYQYEKSLKSLLIEKEKTCHYRDVHSYETAVHDRQRRVHTLDKSIQEYRQKTEDRKRLTEERQRALEDGKKTVQSLRSKVELLRVQECPKGAVCPQTKPAATEATCDSDLVRIMLRKNGYTEAQISQLAPSVKLQDYDIRTHKDFYKYTEKAKLRDCKTGAPVVSTGVGAAADTMSTEASTASSSTSAPSWAEQMAYGILSDTVTQYQTVKP